MRIRSVLSHSAQAVVEGALISLLVVGLLAGTAFAAKPTGGSGGSTGSCSVTPGVVDVGSDYTIIGSGLGANRVVQVWIADSTGTMAWYLQADATGALSLSWHANFAGQSTVSFLSTARHKTTTVAQCSFQVT